MFFLSFQIVAQEPVKQKPYWLSASEFIFSGGSVSATGGPFNTEMDINPIVRFTCFFHLQEQFHYNFNESIGLYTGAGIRNVGMINDLNDSIKVKQRVYSLGVPIALKLGALPDKFNIALGAELELFFHYKQKVFYDDEKFKKTEWFSDKVNIVNPSVFIDIHSGRGAYVRFKYYLLDFLVENKQDIKLYGVPYTYQPESSKMFYVSIGTTIKAFTSKSNKKANDSINTAFVD
jgi:hypothetical protein